MEFVLLQVSDDGPVYVAEILVNMTKESAQTRNTAMVKPCPPGERGEMQVREYNQSRKSITSLKTNSQKGNTNRSTTDMQKGSKAIAKV